MCSKTSKILLWLLLYIILCLLKTEKGKQVYILKFLFFTFIYFLKFWLHVTGCRILVPQSGTELKPPAVEVWSPNHWIVRKSPKFVIFTFSCITDGSLNLFLWIQVTICCHFLSPKQVCLHLTPSAFIIKYITFLYIMVPKIIICILL